MFVGDAYRCFSDIIVRSVEFVSEWRSNGWAVADLFTNRAVPFLLIVLLCVLLFVLILRWVLMEASSFCKTVRDSFGDEPIKSIKDDRLNRGAYVRSLREIVKSWRSIGSQVVGIYGEWGEGKTSLINLFEEQFCKGRRREFDIIRFYPWHSVSPGNIHEELFKCLSSQLGFWNNPYLALLFMSYARKTSSKYMMDSDGLSDFVLALFAWLVSVSSNKDYIKKCIKAKLLQRKRKIIVVVDDLDRLDKNSVIEIIRCTKTNGDFQNVSYFLLSDFKRLATIMEEDVKDVEKGMRYLEKIVQYPCPLWPISEEALRTEATRTLHGVLTSYKITISDDFDEAVDFCLEKVRNLRQVKRLAYSFSISLAYYRSMASDRDPSFDNGTPLNLEADDALKLSVLRMLEPDVVGKLYEFYEKYINEGSMFLLNGCIIDKEEFLKLCDNVSKDNRTWFREFLKETMMIDEKGDAQYPDAVIARGIKNDLEYVGFRLASPKSFRRYFNSAELQSGLIPRKDRLELLNGMLDETKIQHVATVVHRKWQLFRILEVILENNDYKAMDDGSAAFVRAADYIVRNLDKFEAYEEGKQYRLAYDICRLASENLTRLLRKGLLSSEKYNAIVDWIISSKSYVLGLFFLYYCVGQLEPTLVYPPDKIDGVAAEKLWNWVKVELSCKIFMRDIEDRSDGVFIQKFFMLILLERLPVNMNTFRENCEYFISSMDSPSFAHRLNSLVFYNWRGLGSDEVKTRGNLIAQHKIFYMNALTVAEKYVLSHPNDLSIKDLKFLQEMGHGYQTEVSDKMSELYKERIGE